MVSQNMWFRAVENNDRHDNERRSLGRNSRVDGSWAYPQWALLRKVWYLQLRCNNVGTLHFNQTMGRSKAWTGNITEQQEYFSWHIYSLYITSFCILLRLFMLLLTRELGLRFLKDHWESLFQVLWLLLLVPQPLFVLYGVLFMMCYCLWLCRLLVRTRTKTELHWDTFSFAGLRVFALLTSFKSFFLPVNRNFAAREVFFFFFSFWVLFVSSLSL